MHQLRAAGELTGRVLLAGIFLAGALDKITDFQRMSDYMAGFGVPPALMLPVIAFQALFGIMLVLGYYTIPAALLLAWYSLLTALIFHTDFSEYVQMALFARNLAIAGGLCVVAAHGAGRWSIDARQGR